ncbi:hypothetical protein BLA29_005281 [Euroglyphus maynei]|uniref:WW domain-containing protein n=1 Tax=Euroglyphus maynei TaxID=6958 RepID=A0A1Y3BPM9_EURMA|nr:hypothetical protein BLA29_005281 [Euroglyphus maynei]
MNSLLPDTDSEDELPPGWEQKVSLTNRVYYLNNKTKTTQWIHPISGKRKAVSGKLPEGWQRKFDDDGNHVLYHK